MSWDTFVIRSAFILSLFTAVSHRVLEAASDMVDAVHQLFIAV